MMMVLGAFGVLVLASFAVCAILAQYWREDEHRRTF